MSGDIKQRYRVRASCPAPRLREGIDPGYAERNLVRNEKDGSYSMRATFTRTRRTWTIEFEGDAAAPEHLIAWVENELGQTAKISGFEFGTRHLQGRYPDVIPAAPLTVRITPIAADRGQPEQEDGR